MKKKNRYRIPSSYEPDDCILLYFTLIKIGVIILPINIFLNLIY